MYNIKNVYGEYQWQTAISSTATMDEMLWHAIQSISCSQRVRT